MVTMKDIAKEAGVSRSAVSFVLNKHKLSERITKNTRERIERTAAEMKYAPNEIARSMVNGRSKTLGIIVDHNSESEFGAKLIAGMMKRASEYGYVIKLFRSGSDVEKVLNFCISQCLDGVAFQGGLSRKDQGILHRALAKKYVPMAFLSAGDVISKGIHIMSNDFQGGRLIFEHFYKLGHRRFVLLSEHTGMYAQQRIGGFLDAMKKRGMSEGKENILLLKCIRKEKIRETLDCMLSTYSAIFCCTDYLAAFVLTSLLRNGIKVPEDISVAGYGKLRFADCLSPDLTTVEEFQERQAARAVDLLLNAIEKKDIKCFNDKISENMDVELVVGKSSGPVRQV